MADVLQYDIRQQRNEDFQEEWSLSDRTYDPLTGEPVDTPLDMTGWTFGLKLKAAAGDVTVLLTLPTNASATATGIYPVRRVQGAFIVTVKAASIAALLNANTFEPIVLAYDLVFTDAGGLAQAYIRGSYTLEPGVS